MQVKLTKAYKDLQNQIFKNPDGTYKTQNGRMLCYFYDINSITTTDGESWKPSQVALDPANAEIIDLQGNVLRTVNYTGLITCDENDILTLDNTIANSLIAQGLVEENV